MSSRRIFVTGGAGYLGSTLLKTLAPRLQAGELDALVASDVRETPAQSRLPGIEYVMHDVRSPGLASLLTSRSIESVVHLAAIVTPGARSNRELEYAVDVLGTQNVLEACVAAGVRQIIVTSSGAAYGYHADNPEWLSEDDPVRGNEAFAYSHHKRLVEEMLAAYRREHPELRQVVFRVGTILGETTRNQITAIFDRPRIDCAARRAQPVRLHLGPGRGRRDRTRAPHGRSRHLQRCGRRGTQHPGDRRPPRQASA